MRTQRTGSSPRVWGTLKEDAGKQSSVRFIPAGAGNTPLASLEAHRIPVHPRGCGEHTKTRNGSLVLSGSSPRVRGTLFVMHIT